MNHRRVIGSWVFLLFSIVVFVAMVALLHDYVRNRRITREMAGSLQRIDQLLQQQRFSEALSEIERAADYAGSSLSWLRLIQRAHTAAEGSNDYRVFAAVSRRAADTLSGNRDLQALAVYGEMRIGNYALAGERAAARLADDRAYRSLAAEAFLRAGRAERLDPQQHGELAVLTQLGRDSTTEELLQAASMTGDPRLRANAVMRALEAGQWATAATLSDDLRLQRTFPLLSAYIQFDRGDFEGFFNSLERVSGDQVADTEILLMTADVYLSRALYDQAARLYDELIQSADDTAALPPELFLNRGWIHVHQWSERQVGAAILEHGLALHPDEWELRRALVVELSAHQSDRARELLTQAGSDRRASADLLQQQLFADRREVSPSVASLWRLLESHPEDPAVKRFLAWYLSGMPQLAELRRLLALHPAREDHVDPLLFYRGVSAVAESSFEVALQHFSTAARKENDWHAAVNAARISLHLRRPEDAAEMVEIARTAALEAAATEQQQAATASLEATLYASQGQYSASAERARWALQLDGANVHARSVLRYLETR